MPSGLWVTMPCAGGSRHATCTVKGVAASAPCVKEWWVPQRGRTGRQSCEG